jgi:hypothetical protein
MGKAADHVSQTILIDSGLNVNQELKPQHCFLILQKLRNLISLEVVIVLECD